MVTRRASLRYEELQLDLIVQEYRSQGFEIDRNFSVANSNYTFDAVAKKTPEGKIIFIELLNRDRAASENEVRIAALNSAAKEYPKAEVDFRYLDTQVAPYVALMEQGSRRAQRSDLATLLKRKLPPKPKSELEGSISLLELWCLHTLTIRAYAATLPHPLSEEENVLDLYNHYLRLDVFVQPEQSEQGVEFDLFQIHEAVMSATQGAVVEVEYSNQLREHVKSLRRRLRRLTQ